MLIADIHERIAVRDWEGLFHYYLFGRPVVKVEIIGVLLSINRAKDTRHVYHIDDGTGIIRCFRYFNASDEFGVSTPQWTEGTLVSVLGLLERTAVNGQDSRFSLKVNVMEACTDINMETLFKLQAIYLMENVYNQPFAFPR
jgi:hypothetical protein